VLGGLKDFALTDRVMALVALATIRAETERFLPVDEAVSRYNTDPGGAPFGLYDRRADLGNQGPPDGERFRGRGFVQLTGRANYRRHGPLVGVADLIDRPELANDPWVAGCLLASFLGSVTTRIRNAVAAGNLKVAREAVNGGSHGLDRFLAAYAAGAARLA